MSIHCLPELRGNSTELTATPREDKTPLPLQTPPVYPNSTTHAKNITTPLEVRHKPNTGYYPTIHLHSSVGLQSRIRAKFQCWPPELPGVAIEPTTWCGWAEKFHEDALWYRVPAPTYIHSNAKKSRFLHLTHSPLCKHLFQCPRSWPGVAGKILVSWGIGQNSLPSDGGIRAKYCIWHEVLQQISPSQAKRVLLHVELSWAATYLGLLV